MCLCLYAPVSRSVSKPNHPITLSFLTAIEKPLLDLATAVRAPRGESTAVHLSTYFFIVFYLSDSCCTFPTDFPTPPTVALTYDG